VSARPPAVLVATPFLWEGGPGRGKPTVHHLVQGFLRHGYDVHLLSATNRAGVADAVVDGAHLHHFRVGPVGVRFQYDALHSFLTAVRAERPVAVRHLKFRAWWLQFVSLGSVHAVRLARRLRPAVTYGVNNPGVPVAVAAARASGVPAVARIMGTELAQFAGLEVGAPGGRPRVAPAALLRVAMVRFDELLAFKLPCAAWVVTDDGQIGARELTGWLGLPAERVHLWRNGVDKARLAGGPDREAARARLGVAPTDRVVLWVSQLTDWKHPERLLAAAPHVLAAVPQALFLFVGDGPERPALERLARSLGVWHRVRMAGFVPYDSVPAYYRAADVFTAFYDRANVSNTLQEAMLAGVAVVTLDNGLTSAVVKDGETGLLVPPADPERIGPALARVLGDDDLRRRLAEGAALWARNHLETWEERIDREIALIEALPGAKASRLP
jgi:glycosyltransferase involved in cell wall biosynthesis